MAADASTISVSAAEATEAMRLAEVEFAAFEADSASLIWPLLHPHDAPFGVERQMEERAGRIQEMIKHNTRRITKATIEGRIVGYAEWVPPGADDMVHLEDSREAACFTQRFQRCLSQTRADVLGQSKYWYLVTLAVDPPHWCRGVGRMLVQWGINEAQDDPAGPVDSFLEASLMGEAFYHKLGFVTLGWDCIMEDGAEKELCRWPYLIRRGRRG